MSNKKPDIQTTVGEVVEFLNTKGLKGKYEQKNMEDERGDVIHLNSDDKYGGLIINCFDTKAVTVQGKGFKKALESDLKEYLANKS